MSPVFVPTTTSGGPPDAYPLVFFGAVLPAEEPETFWCLKFATRYSFFFFPGSGKLPSCPIGRFFTPGIVICLPTAADILPENRQGHRSP